MSARKNKSSKASRPQARRRPAVPSRPDGAYLDLVMRAINEGVYDLDLAAGTAYFSEGVVRATGMTPRQLRTPQDWRKRIHRDDLPKYDAAMVAHFKGRTERFECDYRFRALDGSWRWARQHGIAVRDASGRAVRMVGSTGDISELKRTEQALKESQERYALATQAATEGIYEWNLETGSLYASQRAKDFFGLKGQALTPASWNRRIHREDFPGYTNAIVEYFKGRRKAFEYEYRIRNAKGGYIWVLDRGVAVRNAAGKVVRMVGAVSDITQRKNHEIELQRARDEATEALERQTATAEILKVIASSPTDVQPVLDAVAKAASRLCESADVLIQLRDGDGFFSNAAHYGPIAAMPRGTRVPLNRESVTGRAMLEGRQLHVLDLQKERKKYPRGSEIARKLGYRTNLTTPMIRNGIAIGTILVRRTEARLFDDKQIALLRTFADQAVIAIENVRLFNETKEALERQTATAEILRVIASSPSDVQPVFDAIVGSARRLLGGFSALVTRLEGETLHLAALTSTGAAGDKAARRRYPAPLSSLFGPSNAIRTKAPFSVADATSDRGVPRELREFARARGYRSVLFVPMLLAGEAIGTVSVTRREAGPFSRHQIQLLQTFADQAVIAIENVRLFNETKEALEQQKASAEVLGAISSSIADTSPVFERILQSCERLFGSKVAGITMLGEDGKLHLQGYHGQGHEEFTRALFPMPIDRNSGNGAAISNGRIFHVPDSEAPDVPDAARIGHRATRTRASIFAPMLWQGRGIGTIFISRETPGPFSDKEIGLLKTFADQAVIAIENVRLFNETKESLERQTASAEVLKVIASSPAEVQPVFDAIVKSCLDLFGGTSVALFLARGNMIDRAAFRLGPDIGDEGKDLFPIPLDETSINGRVILRGQAANHADVMADPAIGKNTRATAMRMGHRSLLAVPLLREGKAIGSIAIFRKKAERFSDQQVALLQTFADQAAIAIQNARLFNETRESLERQTATAEILKVIASSPSDVRPVFDTIVQTAKRLIGAFSATVTHVSDGMLHLVAHTATTPEGAEALHKYFPHPVEGSAMGRAILSRRPEFIDDFEADSDDARNGRELARSRGFRSVVFVPLMRSGVAIGSLNVTRREAGRMSDHQIDLLKTFADQAVIAIENVRLFNETKEALERQTATAEILKVIASSPSDVQPVFDAIVASAMRLLKAATAHMTRLEGGNLHLAAFSKTDDEGAAALRRLYPFAVAGTSVEEPLKTKTAMMVADVETDPRSSDAIRATSRARGVRSFVLMPVVSKGTSIGNIVVNRREAGPFSEHEIELLKTFADQAVIAIENVRLFNETRESLERQTATAEILNVIASSPSDVQPVFDAIAASARRLLDANAANVTRRVGDKLELVAYTSSGEVADAELRKLFPAPITGQGHLGKAILSAAPVGISDLQTDQNYSESFRAMARMRGVRGVVSVPMLREGEAIGVISVNRRVPGKFSEHQTNLLKTFADQAVIAIENVRLFNETKEALERQTATAEILKVISSSPTDTQPVFDTIAANALRLCQAKFSVVTRFDGKLINFAALANVASPESTEAIRSAWPQKPGPTSATSRAIELREPVQIPDILEDPRYRLGELAEKLAFRSVLAVPMLRSGEPLGAIVVQREQPGEFPADQIALLKTFADQAAIAIENVRLFNETKESLERQTATAEILKVISSSPTDTQPVFDAIVASAARLFGRRAMLRLVEADGLRRRAVSDPASVLGQGEEIMPVDRDSLTGRVILDRKAMQVVDTRGPDAPPFAKTHAHKWNFRSNAAAPLIRDGKAIGVITVNAPEPGAMSDKQMALLATFADQAVIAIENVRLFKELQQRIGQMTALSEVGQAISSTLDLETVLKTIVSRALQLTGLDAGVMYEYDEAADQFQLRASENFDEEGVAALRSSAIRKGEGAVGTSVVTREPVQVPDTHAADYPLRLRELLDRFGYRALLAVPLLREEQIIGALTMFRRMPGAFAPEAVELLKTFGTQSAMAIQNARLFREIADKGKQLEIASQHKSNFLASMSHELRTPLNAILGFNEMILDQVYGEISPDVKAPLENMQTSGKHLLRLINNVLDLAKIEAGRMELALSDYSVQDTVASVHSTLKPLAAEKGLEFVMDVPADIALAHGDGGRIAQCLMNLAGNSIKFTKAGRVTMAVAQNDGLLRYSVADTGIGIPPDKIGSLFTEFKQTDATIASEYGGTGLGLSISKKFIEMHGGRIWVESELGKGSAFIFEIPLRVNS